MKDQHSVEVRWNGFRGTGWLGVIAVVVIVAMLLVAAWFGIRLW
jgi:hypothetical protein